MKSPYRQEHEPSKKPARITVDAAYLEDLERCKEILALLDRSRADVQASDGYWEVQIPTGDVALETYPVVAEGSGKTLREAVESAKGWCETRGWELEPKPRLLDPGPLSVFLLGCLFGLLIAALA